MILKLEEDTWEHTAIPRIEKKVGSKYSFICKDTLCIEIDDILNLLNDLEDELDHYKDEVEKYKNDTEENRKWTAQEMIWEGKRQ